MARTYDISKKQNYIRSLYCKEDDKFHDIFQTANDKKNIQLSPEEGKLLSMLLTIHQSKYVLELGTFPSLYRRAQYEEYDYSVVEKDDFCDIGVEEFNLDSDDDANAETKETEEG